MTTERAKGTSPAEDPATAAASRRARPLAATILAFDFEEEAAKLREEAPWREHGRNAVTLAKYDDFRIVFMLMKPGARMQEHHASARISVQTLSGHVRLHLTQRTVDLPAGHLVALEREVVHDVEAVAESAVLLTIAWPGGAAS